MQLWELAVYGCIHLEYVFMKKKSECVCVEGVVL